MRATGLVAVIGAAGVVACAGGAVSPAEDAPAPPRATVGAVADGGGGERAPGTAFDPFDVPIDGATEEQVAAFEEGDRLFETVLRDADGLGPLYTRPSCGACHASGVRGPGAVQKMAVVEADGFTTAADQSILPWGHTVHPLTAGGGITPVLPPSDPRVKVSVRVGPPILGRGYMEAVDDAEIERVAREQSARSDAIHGRVNHVVYASEANSDTTFHRHAKGDLVIGRFGVKARVATLDDFTADALQGDMGITSPLRPVEVPNPDGFTDDKKPGVDVAIESVNVRATYLRLTAIPRRSGAPEPGRALFERARCSVCHAPSLRTRADYPIAALAGVDAPLYTDMLLHDLGVDLADGMIDGEAGSRDWRTAPLVGLRFNKTFLHDGRARTVEQAILLHDGPGSEAHEAVETVRAWTASERAALVAFVGGL